MLRKDITQWLVVVYMRVFCSTSPVVVVRGEVPFLGFTSKRSCGHVDDEVR